MNGRCELVRAGAAGKGPTGVTYAAGVSSATAGATGLCLQLASLPPGARARAHQHDRHESAAYVIEGQMVLWSGDRLGHKLVAGPGDFIYIPPGVPHLVMNGSETEPTSPCSPATTATSRRTSPSCPSSTRYRTCSLRPTREHRS